MDRSKVISIAQTEVAVLFFRMFNLPVKLAFRDLRGGIASFRIFITCLILGVAAISGVGSVSKAMNAGITKDSQRLLGGDFSIQLTHRPISPEANEYIQTVGRVSAINNMRAMVKTDKSERRTLIELKAVDDVYPLFGQIKLFPDISLRQALRTEDGQMGAVIDPALSQRLNLGIGDKIKIGNNFFIIRAEIIDEPDRVVRFTTFGPRVMIHSSTLEKTGLLVKGSLAKFNYRVKLKKSEELSEIINDLDRSFPSAGWRIRTVKNAVPGFDRFNKQVTQFLTLIGLTALLVGGLGIANAVRNFLEKRTATIAILKSLGAPGRLIFQVYLIQTMSLASIGIILGITLGASSPFWAATLISNFIPIDLPKQLYWQPILTAILFGYLMTLLFSAGPLRQATAITPAQLFRAIVSIPQSRPNFIFFISICTLVLLLASLAVLTTDDRRLAISFVGGAVFIFIIFNFFSKGIIGFLKKFVSVKHLSTRLAVANIHRPGSPASGIILSLGLGLTLLLTIVLVENNMRRQLEEQIPKIAPSYFFIDIQPHQEREFTNVVQSMPGIIKIEKTPMVRGRVVRINDTSVEQVKPDPDIAWAINGDRGLTYMSKKPPNTKLTKGLWWPTDYKGPPLISLDANVARGIRVSVGDTITLNILGQEITATIGSLRYIDWTNLEMNFVFIFSPGTLETAPHSIISAVYASNLKAEENLQKTVTDLFPNVSAISVKNALENANRILTAISVAIKLTALVTLLAGILVLIGAFGAQQQKRIYDATIYKVLGGTRKRILLTYLIEYGLLGFLSAFVSIILASSVSWIIVAKIIKTDFSLSLTAIFFTTAISLVLTISLGLFRTWRSLGMKASSVLRS
ncbi:MAG: ABC transporter permease [Thalassobaculaceae bacterium]